MVIDMRTRLPHSHLLNRAEDMAFHVRRLSDCARRLRDAQNDLTQALERNRALIDG
ncbi:MULTISPECIES: hypothetical protein [Rhodospirillales]|uniref:Uncharacterized protein n=2 Tax=Rhodospirillales TaxID=204441 RepID=B6IP60_RHOCS|nr:hypothetical protein [Rhodospirillum centenum]ACI99562.1 hypothetical protein RC1_2175 [Rhodospirillum centenum SW]